MLNPLPTSRNGLATRSRLLAVAGIVICVLSIMSSSEKRNGTPAMPFALILLSRTAMLAFVVAATISLWKRARTLALVFAVANWIRVLAFAMALTQETLTLKRIPMILSQAPAMWPDVFGPFGIPIVIMHLVMWVANPVLYIWVIVKLLRMPRPALLASALPDEPTPRSRGRTGVVLGGLVTAMSIALVVLFGISARRDRLARMNFLAKHPALRSMYAVQSSLENWAKANGGAYPYATEFDTDSSRFMKYLARDRTG